MKVIFMGTPDFAVASLKALLDNGIDIAAVVTTADKPAGRGQKINESAVKKFALEQGLRILQPVRLKDESFLNELRSIQADLQVIVAFRMLPELVWNMPPKGTVNLHASLLPEYRGAAPINWAIINGENETGVSTFFLKQEIDTGDLLFTERVAIGPDETAGELHDKLMNTGAQVLVKTVKAIEQGNYRETPQPNLNELKTAPKIFKENCQINWDQPVERVHNFIRGLSPYPAAFTSLQNKSLKIFKASPEKSDLSYTPGTINSDNKTYLKFACKDGFISVQDLQLEGKKRMKIDEFLRGVKL
jgi:methionyl-tRNA formyltransferase